MDDEVERRKEIRKEWIRIHQAVARDRDLRDLYLEFHRQNPNPTDAQADAIRREMLEACEEMNV